MVSCFYNYFYILPVVESNIYSSSLCRRLYGVVVQYYNLAVVLAYKSVAYYSWAQGLDQSGVIVPLSMTYVPSREVIIVQRSAYRTLDSIMQELPNLLRIVILQNRFSYKL